MSCSHILLITFVVVSASQTFSMNDQLIEVTKNDNYQKVAELLNQNADVNVRDKNGFTPLMIAVFKGNEEIAQLLIDRKVDVNVVNRKGLMAAFKDLIYGSPYKGISVVEMCKLIDDKDVDFYAEKINKWTPLMIASDRGYINIVRLLIHNGAHVNTSDGEGHTPLNLALRTAKNDITKLLIDNGANIHFKDRYGESPLTISSRNGSTEIVRLLLSKNVNPNIANNEGQTPIMLAAFWGGKKIVEMLLDKNAHVNATSKDGMTPLLWAVAGKEVDESAGEKEDRREIVKMLINAGANVNAISKDGFTPLHVPWFRELMEKGCK